MQTRNLEDRNRGDHSAAALVAAHLKVTGAGNQP
jgi:hypothetical protein